MKGLFWTLTALLLLLLGLLGWFVVRSSSLVFFFIVEGLVIVTVVYLIVFYHKMIKPLQIIGDGMELLREQDFSSRLRYVGQTEADRIVEIFNKMMEQLKHERISLREQNHFLDLLVKASPLGVVILNLDEEIVSLNPAACKIFQLPEGEKYQGKKLIDISSVLAQELQKIPMYESQTLRLSDANIYKCIHSSFVDKGFHHPFYLLESLTEEVFKAEKKHTKK